MLSISHLRRMTFALAGCAALFAPVSANAGMTNLDLINGWKDSPFSTAKASVVAIKGVVHFRGAMVTAGTNSQPFVLPAPFHPSAKTYVPVDLCTGSNGRLVILSNGQVDVESEGSFSDAQCMTSLDGASFALSTDGFKPLKLKHGWKPYGLGTATPAVRNIGGIVRFEGAMATKKSSITAFILPTALRPSTTLYVKADLYGVHNGRLEIDPDGTTRVEENAATDGFSFTSLDGVSFSLNSDGFTPLTLINGWFSTSSVTPAVKVVGGVVYLQGAIATHDTSFVPFVLPAAMTPTHNVYIPVDMCAATNGRLAINTEGSVSVEAESDPNNAKCFTSLDGVSFHL